MNLYQWAIKHSVGMDALAELRALWGDVDKPNLVLEGKPRSEAFIQSAALLEGAEKGVRLYRNNVGALQDDTGRLVRYGLANDSRERNGIIKSGDHIGIRPVYITPEMVGSTIGQFVSREYKAEDWKFGDKPAQEGPQMAWAQLILSLGGDAKIVNYLGHL